MRSDICAHVSEVSYTTYCEQWVVNVRFNIRNNKVKKFPYNITGAHALGLDVQYLDEQSAKKDSRPTRCLAEKCDITLVNTRRQRRRAVKCDIIAQDGG